MVYVVIKAYKFGIYSTVRYCVLIVSSHERIKDTVCGLYSETGLYKFDVHLWEFDHGSVHYRLLECARSSNLGSKSVRLCPNLANSEACVNNRLVILT